MKILSILFQGRINRSQWLVGKLYAILGVLVSLLAMVLFYILARNFFNDEVAYFLAQVLFWLSVAFIGLIQISLDVRRLHDIGKDWQWALFSYVFLPALIPYLLVLAFKAGLPGSNEHGNSPTERRSMRMIFNL